MFSLILFPRRSCEDFCFGLWIAYVMYSAKERIESADKFRVRIAWNASRKFPNVSAVNVSSLSASNHFLAIPDK